MNDSLISRYREWLSEISCNLVDRILDSEPYDPRNDTRETLNNTNR